MARRAPARDLRKEMADLYIEMALSKLQKMLPNQLDDRSEDVAAEEERIKTELELHAALLFQGTHLHALIFNASILKAGVPSTGDILPETGCQVIPTDPNSQDPNDSPWQRFHLQNHPPKSPSDSCSEEQKYLRSSHLALYRGRQYDVLFYDPSVLDITWAGWKEGTEVETVVQMPTEGLRIIPRTQLNQSRNRPMWVLFKLKTEEPADKVHPEPASIAQPSTLHSVPDHPDTSGDPRHIARSESATRSAGDWPAAIDATEQPTQSSDQQTEDAGSSSASVPDPSRRGRNGFFLSAQPYSSTNEPGACGACFDRRRHSGDVIRDLSLHQLHNAMNRIHVGPQRRSSFAFENQNVNARPDPVPPITDVLAGHESVPIHRSNSNMPPGMADAIAITEPVTPTRITARLPGDERGSTHQPSQSGVPWTRPTTLVEMLNSPPMPISPKPKSPILRAALEKRINITSPNASRAVPAVSPRSRHQTSQPESTIQQESAKFQKIEDDVSEDPKGKQAEEKMDVDDQTQPPETVKPVTRSGQSQKSAKSQESWTKPSTRSGTASPQKPSTSKSESLLKQAIGSNKAGRKQSETDSPKVGRKKSRGGSESSETETDSDVQNRIVTRAAKDRKGSKSEQSEESGSEGQSKRASSADKAKKVPKGTPRKQTKASTSKAAEGTSGEDPDAKGTPRKTRSTDPKSEEPSKKSADTPLRKSSRHKK